MPSLFPPGPRNIYPLRNLLGMSLNMLPYLHRIATTYGDVASLKIASRRLYLASDPALIRNILVADADLFTKGPALRMTQHTLGEGLLTSEGDKHRRQRRLIQPAFHPKRISQHTNQIVFAALEEAARWQPNQPFDIVASMTRLTLKIIAKVLFDAEIDSEVEELGAAMDVTVRMFDRARSPLAPLLNRLPLKSNYRFLQASARLDQTISQMIARRHQHPKGQNDLLTLLLNARDEEGDGNGMDDQQIRAEMMTLFAAGHETTANAMVWTWLLLSQNPHEEAKLHEELSNVLSGRPPTAEDLPNLTYTRDIITESMRLYPPAWIIARQAKADYQLRNWTVPKAGIILMSQWIVHRDQRWFPNPLKFDPARWQTDNDARPRYAYFPFGGGPRQCIGEAFAWTEATLLLATLAQKWRLQRTDNKKVKLHATITLRPRHPLIMQPLPR